MFIRSVGFIKYELYVIFFFNNVCIVERCCFDVEFDFKWISYFSEEYFELFTWRLIILNLKHLKKKFFSKKALGTLFQSPSFSVAHVRFTRVPFKPLWTKGTWT